MIRWFPGDELPLVKPLRVTKQTVNLGDNNLLAEGINRGVILLLNIVNNAVDGCFFFG